MKTLLFLTVIVYFQQSFCKNYYTNYTLYRSIPHDENQLDFFYNLSAKYDVTFWRRPGQLYYPIDIMIAPTDKQAVIREAIERGVGLEVILADVQKVFDQQTVIPYIRNQKETFNWRGYYRIDSIYNWLRDLSKAHPGSTTLMNIGSTYEGRDILAITVDIGKWQRQPRPKIIIEGGIHAREWISPAYVTFLIDKIINALSSDDEQLKRIALLYEWNFVPVLNPDGYEYTHVKNRLWRKNRNMKYGIDLNRNFGYEFGKADSSYHPLSNIYCGPASFSEQETKAMAYFVTSKSVELKYFFAFHSYGQLIILPYTASTKRQENYDEMAYMSHKAAHLLYKTYGTQYKVGTATETVGYAASGTTMDWVKNTFKVPYAATFELPDTGGYGFGLLPKYIQPTCEETMTAVLSLVDPQSKVNKTTWNQGWKGWKANCPKRLKLDITLLCYFSIFIIVG